MVFGIIIAQHNPHINNNNDSSCKRALFFIFSSHFIIIWIIFAVLCSDTRSVVAAQPTSPNAPTTATATATSPIVSDVTPSYPVITYQPELSDFFQVLSGLMAASPSSQISTAPTSSPLTVLHEDGAAYAAVGVDHNVVAAAPANINQNISTFPFALTPVCILRSRQSLSDEFWTIGIDELVGTLLVASSNTTASNKWGRVVLPPDPNDAITRALAALVLDVNASWALTNATTNREKWRAVDDLVARWWGLQQNATTTSVAFLPNGTYYPNSSNYSSNDLFFVPAVVYHHLVAVGHDLVRGRSCAHITRVVGGVSVPSAARYYYYGSEQDDGLVVRWVDTENNHHAFTARDNTLVYPLAVPVVLHVPASHLLLPVVSQLLLNENVQTVYAQFGMAVLPPSAVMDVYAVTAVGGGGGDRVVVTAGGSTAILSLMQHWFVPAVSATGVAVIYSGVGSGAGISDVLSADRSIGPRFYFTGSDVPLSAEQLLRHPTKAQVPVAATSVSFVYNLPDTAHLYLPTCHILHIVARQIVFWDDPAIAAVNPTVTLPHEPIRLCVRSGKSGTTEILIDGLQRLHRSAMCSAGSDVAALLRLVQDVDGGTWPFGDAALLGQNVSANNATDLAFLLAELTERQDSKDVLSYVSSTQYALSYVPTPDVTTSGLLELLSPVRTANVWSPSGGLLQPTGQSVASTLTNAINYMPPVTPTTRSITVPSGGEVSLGMYPFVGVS
eukprot:PhM_4_TR10040/c0_g1_i1/m.99241